MNKIFLSIGLLALSGLTSTLFGQTILIDEHFDNGIPSNYLLIDKDGYTPHEEVSEYTAPWISIVDPFDSTNNVASSTSYFDSPGMAERWMIIPSIQLGGFGSTLEWSARSHDPSFSESYLVLISTTGTNVEDFTDTLLTVMDEAPFWNRYSINLSDSGYVDQTIHVAFILGTIDGFKFYMDSIYVETESPLSIGQLKEELFTVYPNPASDILQLKTDTVYKELIIRSVHGQVVARTTSKEVDVRSLESGIYLVEMVHEKGISSTRFIKK